MEGIQARSHVVAFWVRAHEPSQIFEPVTHQLCLTQLLGHRRNPLIRCPELGIFSFHRHLPISCQTFYAAKASIHPPESLRNGVRLSLLGCGLLGSAYTPVGESIEPVRRKAWAGVVLDVSSLQQFID